MYIIIAILLFGILIAAHEWGHFIAARLCGVTVHEFSIGMGPAIWHRTGKKVLCPLAVTAPWKGKRRNQTIPTA